MVQLLCRIGILKKGKLIKEVDAISLRHSEFKTYKIELNKETDFNKMRKKYPSAKFKTKEKQIIISINDSEINELIRALATCDIHFMKEEKHTLEEYFMKFYGDDEYV